LRLQPRQETGSRTGLRRFFGSIINCDGMSDPTRPDPDALLASIRRSEAKDTAAG